MPNMIRYPAPATRLCTIIALISFFTFPSQAQRERRFNYFGGGMTLATTTMMDNSNIFALSKPFFLYGGGYDVTIRQEINDFLSLESGLNVFNFHMTYPFMGEYTEHWGLMSHNIPLKAELEVDLLRDRIALYGSFGIQFNYADQTSYGWGTLYMNHVELEYHKNYLPETRVYSRYIAGSGARFRLVDQLIFELELGFGFRVKDLLEYEFTYRDDSGTSTDFIIREPTDYWYISYGISYPIQRVMDGYRKVRKELMTI
jgi:hypothetical protein